MKTEIWSAKKPLPPTVPVGGQSPPPPPTDPVPPPPPAEVRPAARGDVLHQALAALGASVGAQSGPLSALVGAGLGYLVADVLTDAPPPVRRAAAAAIAELEKKP